MTLHNVHYTYRDTAIGIFYIFVLHLSHHSYIFIINIFIASNLIIHNHKYFEYPIFLYVREYILMYSFSFA